MADWLQNQLRPKGVGVVIQAGVQATGVTTMTSTLLGLLGLLGLLRTDARSRSEFLTLTGLPG